MAVPKPVRVGHLVIRVRDVAKSVKWYEDVIGLKVTDWRPPYLREGEVVNALYDAHERDIDAALINPAGYTTGTGPLVAAIAQVRFPVIEVHASNPTSRGTVSKIQPVSKGSVYGFGVYGYYLALEAVKQMEKV